jgi:hypothetical protein
MDTEPSTRSGLFALRFFLFTLPVAVALALPGVPPVIEVGISYEYE